MQTRPALLLVLVLALLATGCANRPNLSSGITTETVLSLPPDLEVPAGDTALLYPLSASPEGAKAQVEALVGQPLGEGEPGVSGTGGCSDVAAGNWYTDAVAWAAADGIVNGTTDTAFAPGDDITRQQLVTVLYRYAESKGYDVSVSADLSGYPDAGQVQDYAQPAMAWAVAEGIVEGMDGNLNPTGDATRAQIATILMRFCEGVAK